MTNNTWLSVVSILLLLAFPMLCKSGIHSMADMELQKQQEQEYLDEIDDEVRELMPSTAFFVSIEPSISIESEPEISFQPITTTIIPSPSITPTPVSASGKGGRSGKTTSTTQTYPCVSGFTLHKEYLKYPEFRYICKKPDRLDAKVLTAQCPSGWYRQYAKCIEKNSGCSLVPLYLSSCIKPVCINAEFQMIQYQAKCIQCPTSYQLYSNAGTYMCYKMLEQIPTCQSGRTFAKDTGTCNTLSTT